MSLQQQIFKRFWHYAGAVSVRTKILGIVLGLVLLLGGGVTLQVRALVHQALVQRLQEQSVITGRDLAARATDLILINDLYALHQLLEETRQNNSDILYAFVVGPEGNVLAHTFGEGFPPDLLAANSAAPGSHHQTVRLLSDQGEVWDTAVPIFEERAGVARVGLSENSAYTTLATLTGQMILTTVAVSAVGIAAAVLMTWVVTRPILRLKEAAQAVGRGDFQQRVTPWAGDEIGEMAAAFNAMVADLALAEAARAEREQWRSHMLEQIIAAQEEERKRIARELHDETGQALTSLKLRLQLMSQQCNVPALKPQIDELRQALTATLEGVHNLARELRPSILDDLGLPAALRRYVDDCRRLYGLQIDLMIRGLDEPRLAPAVETALYRIVQEGLNNIGRHAHASTASILLERRNGRVRAIIEDDGQGFDPAVAASSGRLGLFGIRERAELLGGTLTVESTPGQGTTLFVQVPA